MARRWLGLLVVCVVLAVTGAFVVAGADTESPNRQSCGLDAAKGRIGGSDGASMLSDPADELARELDAARAAGMWSVRVDVDWSLVEPARGQRDWSDVDRVIDAVTARGMCPLGLVTYAPAWAADPALRPSGSYFAPRDPATFAEFAAAAAQRYRGRVAVWEVWNEPNTEKFFKPRPDATRYGRLLAATYAAIKGVDPGIGVISGGLAPAEDNGVDIAPTTYLEDLYAGKFNSSFDAFGIHPYTYPALPNTPGTAEWNTAQRLTYMRDTMVGGGDGRKSMWITECGAPTGTSEVSVSDAVQAETLRIVFRLAADTSWLGPAFVFNIRDSGSDPTDPEQNFGVIRHDFSVKPAYAVVSELGKAGA